MSVHRRISLIVATVVAVSIPVAAGTGPCDTVRRGDMVRQGAAVIHRFARKTLSEG